MIVKTDFLSAINYAKDHDIMLRPEYSLFWIMYDKPTGNFIFVDNDREPVRDNDNDIINVNINDKILRTFRWEFMCDDIAGAMINPF